MARAVTLPQLVQLRLSDELVKAIDEWRRTQEDIPTRSEAIRRLVEKGLKPAS
ncbi:ribbon-helix-helix protein, CopG family [Brevundimonas vesicularis]|uniref:ribbon-helix-helix protein, CopG family n=1 Tax=Brevundimonas vesicularis TaxID=41276 RepID=UPI003AFFF561